MANKPNFIPHQLTENVKLLHKVAIIQENKVLILKRAINARSRPNMWDLPGGNSEWPGDVGHSMADLHKLDVAREVFEETGIRVKPTVFDDSSLVHFTTFFDLDKQIYTVICGWLLIDLGKMSPEEASVSDEHQELAWVTREQVKDYDFGAKKGQFIVNIIEAGFQVMKNYF